MAECQSDDDDYLEGGILKVEREEATTNYFMTAWLALNGTNVPSLLGDHVFGDAVFKISAKDSLTKPEWTMLAQYKLAPESFDSNHTTRVFIQNPFLLDEFADANGGQLFMRWVIEYEDRGSVSRFWSLPIRPNPGATSTRTVNEVAQNPHEEPQEKEGRHQECRAAFAVGEPLAVGLWVCFGGMTLGRF